MELVQQAKSALGTDAVLTVVAETREQALDLLNQLWEEIDDFEDRFSRFRIDSELSLFNLNAGKPMPVTNAFMKLLRTSDEMSRRTDGMYNPFILPALQQIGYKGSWPTYQLSDPKLDFSKRKVKPYTALKTGDGWAQIPRDSAIDSGGIGKGYLLDQLARTLEGECQGYWISLGGDIIMSGFDVVGQPWKVGIAAAQFQDKQIANVSNKGGRKLAVATSGIIKRGGGIGPKAWHHLIDPSTGMAGETDILTATVVSESGIEADVLASCLVLMGSRKAEQYLRDHDLSGLIQMEVGSSHGQSLRLVGNRIVLENNKATVKV